MSDSHCQYVNCQAGTIAIAITGTASTTAVTSRCRSGRSSSFSASRSGPPSPNPAAPDTAFGSGRRAVYPVASTVAIRSATSRSCRKVTFALSVA